MPAAGLIELLFDQTRLSTRLMQLNLENRWFQFQEQAYFHASTMG